MSSVWKYFEKDAAEPDKAICSQCPRKLICRGSSTSSLIHHLRHVHKIDIETKTQLLKKHSTSSQTSLKKYAKKGCSGLGEILPKCVAEDGISVRAVKNSTAITSLLNLKGMKMPASASTIWSLIEDEYKKRKSEVIQKLNSVKAQNGRFSIIVDEWADISNYKHVNVSVRTYDPINQSFEIYNLGLEQMKIAGSAVNVQQLVTKRLKEFMIDIEKDVVCSTHDGAAVMKKYGMNISAESQLCQNHAILLSVVDTIYAKKNSTTDDVSEDEGDSFAGDSECEEDFMEIDNDLDLKLHIHI